MRELVRHRYGHCFAYNSKTTRANELKFLVNVHYNMRYPLA